MDFCHEDSYVFKVFGNMLFSKAGYIYIYVREGSDFVFGGVWSSAHQKKFPVYQHKMIKG